MSTETINNAPLTQSRKEWAQKFKPNILLGAPLQYNFAIRDRYQKALVSLIKQMTEQTAREIIRNLKTPDAKEYFAQDASVSSSSKILVNQLRKKFIDLFSRKAKEISERMLNETDKASSGSLHFSLKKLSGGLSLGTRVLTGETKEIITASIAENVSLIKSIPQQYFTAIEGAVMRSITTGGGLKDLVPFLKNHESITIKRARLIAGDQSRKAFSNITASRMRELDVKKYRWIHSAGDQEPRPLHQKLNGTIQSLDDPPIIQYAKGRQPEVRGKPGDLINCTCVMQPIVDFSEIENGQ